MDMLLFNPMDWYWLASDGRVYASARQATVTDQDGDYLAWLAQDNRATPWPRDGNDDETVQALQDVLTPYGLFASLTAYAAAKRYDKEVGGVVLGGVPIATDDRSKLMITGARVAANSDPDWTTIWQGADGNSYPLTAEQMIGISDGVQAFVSSCFAIYADVKAEIDAGTITTTGEIDAAFA